MSTSTDSPRRPDRGRLRPVRLLTVGVFALAGLLFFVSFDTARGTDLRSDNSMLRLSDLIQERSDKNHAQDDRNASLRGDVDRLSGRGNGTTAAAQAELKALEGQSGTRPVSGQGLTVTLTDAPPDATPKVPGVPDPQPNDLVIHQQDLQAVVNALWQGGATGIRIMDQRLISTSAVRCVGNTLILQGRVYSPPYKITAVGNRNKLNAALTASAAIQNYLLYVNAYGLGWKVDMLDHTTLPGYHGNIDLHYAQPVPSPGH
ncbi:DUF881 domain-containing protein [Streptomyces sp. NPDC059740]|uniref:DUF881 domain-containing protein n=1 Tax=Streptomyces sp. NPDC059740 TaxID=3346926 RepID=UPI00364CA8FB